ncbi:sialin-like [Lytechinus variegatus]|uniref:sialin-like n=1 Tax=Lytechinus variegatus TaxID=7654 RepID=UPI001BB1BEFE|nr:sialin-like [Lytechinus variegatus]
MLSNKFPDERTDLVKSTEVSYTSSHGSDPGNSNVKITSQSYQGYQNGQSPRRETTNDDDDKHDEDRDETKPLIESNLKAEITDCFPTRYVICTMGYIGFVLVYCLRVTVSIGVAAMVNSSTPRALDDNTSGEYCSDRGGINSTRQDEDIGEFDWDSETQEFILAGFFYGYMFTQLLGGWLADKFGGKFIFALGVLCTSLCSLVFPVASYAGPGVVFATRVISGLGEGFTFPAMFSLFSNWVHQEERGRLAVVTFSGSCLGNILGQAISGVTASTGVLGGWPLPFYIFGSIGLVWFVAWLFLAYNTPAEHPRISLAERKYIESGVSIKKTAKVRVPWNKILTSMPVWAQVIAHMTACWGYFTLLTNLPIYMNDVLRYDLTMAGILSAVPYAVQWASMVIGGMLSDHLINTAFMSRTGIRKLFVTTGLFAYGVTQVLVAVVGCNGALSVTFISLGLGVVGVAFSGYLPNTLDLAPAYSGSIGGLVQSAGPISGILGPYLVGVFTEDQRNLEGWQYVFYISFGVTTFGAIFYLIFASGEEQTWASKNTQTHEHDESDYDKI